MRSVDDWKRELQGKEPQAAYQLVIADDTIQGYEAFAAVFSQSPYTVRVKLLTDRRKEMMAWNTAMIVNTAPSFRSFVVSYPGSDLAATARKLEDRIRNRSLNANAAVQRPGRCRCRRACGRAERDADPGQRADQCRDCTGHLSLQHSVGAAGEEEGRHQAAGEAGRNPAAAAGSPADR